MEIEILLRAQQPGMRYSKTTPRCDEKKGIKSQATISQLAHVSDILRLAFFTEIIGGSEKPAQNTALDMNSAI